MNSDPVCDGAGKLEERGIRHFKYGVGDFHLEDALERLAGGPEQ